MSYRWRDGAPTHVLSMASRGAADEQWHKGCPIRPYEWKFATTGVTGGIFGALRARAAIRTAGQPKELAETEAELAYVRH